MGISLSALTGAPRRHNLLGLVPFVIAAFAPPSLLAQKADQPDLAALSLEQLMTVEVATVNAASKFDQKVTSAPSYVTIITAEEIHLYGYRTLADLLAGVPGFYVNNDRNYSYLGIRGFQRPGDYNDRILLMIDGHRLNDPVYGEALIGTEFPLDVALIQRVEIVRGPGSALYGTNAFFAVINVITRRGRDVKGTEVSGDAGSLGTYRGRGTFGNQWANGPEMLVSGTFYASHGNDHLFFPEFNTPVTNNGIAVNADGDRFYNFLASLEYGDFSLQGLYGSRMKQIPTGSFGTVFNDPRTRTTDSVEYFDLTYRHQFKQWQVLGRVAYDQDAYHGVYVYDYSGTGIPPYTLNQDLSNGERVTVAFDASRVFFDKHRLTVGAETQLNLKQDQSNYDQSPYLLYLNDHRSSTVPAVYVQDEFSVRDNLILTAGLRLDHYGNFGATVNPRVGLIYNPRERTTLKLLYGSAFRAPNDYELYYASPPYVANHSLLPERIKTAEIVLEQYFAKHAHVGLSAFYNDIRDLISQQIAPVTGALSFANLDNVQGKGVEFELAGKWPNGFQGRLSYSFQESQNQQLGDVLSNSPKHLAKFNLSAPVLPKRAFLSLEGLYNSPVQTLASAQVGGFFLANATLSGPAKGGFSFSAGAYNLFNKRYADPAGPEFTQDSIVQDGRTLRVAATYRFGKW